MVVFILNRSPIKALEGQTPYEAWHRHKLNIMFLRTFGCVGHVKNTKPFLDKLEDRSTPMVLVGYESMRRAARPTGFMIQEEARWWSRGTWCSTK